MKIKKISVFLLIFSIFFTACSQQEVKIPYEKKNDKYKCDEDKITFYRKIINETTRSEYLKNIVIDTGNLTIKYSDKFKTNEEIDLYNFNDKYTSKEDLCKSADIRYENYIKIKKIFKNLEYKEGFNQWTKLLAYYIKNIEYESKNMNDWEKDYIQKLTYTKIDNKPLNLVVFNNTGNSKLNFNIKDLNIHWKYIKKEKNLQQEFNDNLILIDIKPIPSKKYILDNLFEECNLVNKSCLKIIEKKNKNLYQLSIQNKNKMIKFEKLLKGSLNKYKTFPYITSIFGDNINHGVYLNNSIRFEQSENDTINITIENNIKKKIIPDEFMVRDYNFKIKMNKNILTLINNSRSDITAMNIIITNNKQNYYISGKYTIPYKSQIKINLSKYNQYQESIYHIFKSNKEKIVNKFGIYAEYKKNSYKKNYAISNYEKQIYYMNPIINFNNLH